MSDTLNSVNLPSPAPVKAAPLLVLLAISGLLSHRADAQATKSAKVEAGALNAASPHVRRFGAQDLSVEADLATQVLQLDIPEDTESGGFAPADGAPPEPGQASRTTRIEASIEPALKLPPWGTPFISASMLLHKAKLVDDRVSATIELAAQRGAGRFPSKAGLLRALAARLTEKSIPRGSIKAASVILGAAELSQTGFVTPKAWKPAVTSIIEDFLSSPLRSKPVGFYTWTTELPPIFQQDRLLQTELADSDGPRLVAEVLGANPPLLSAHKACLELNERTVDAASLKDFRALLGISSTNGSGAETDRFCFFPPSSSLETRLVMQMFRNQRIPEGFDLAEEIVRRAQHGQLQFTPDAGNGWHAYQTWSLEPLALPEKCPEAARLKLLPTYKRQLLALLKAALALGRETHIKQLEIVQPTSEIGRPREKVKIRITPELSLEPLPTLYARKADGYRFLRRELENQFGKNTLEQLSLIEESGTGAESLGHALDEMESLFNGAAVAACTELGMDGGASPRDTAASDFATFRSWATGLKDIDLTNDVRMMVPVFHDVARGKTKAWVLLGWSARPLEITFARIPAVRVFYKDGKPAPEEAYEVIPGGTRKSLAYPVTSELYVSRILDRDEFRRHCDRYRTQSEILKHLE
jgi:hypothetical protein